MREPPPRLPTDLDLQTESSGDELLRIELANQLIGLECRLRRALVGTRVMPPAPLAGD